MRRSTRLHSAPEYLVKHYVNNVETIVNNGNYINVEQRVEFALMVDTLDTGGIIDDKYYTPTCYKDAAKYDHWIKATQDEYDSLRFD